MGVDSVQRGACPGLSSSVQLGALCPVFVWHQEFKSLLVNTDLEARIMFDGWSSHQSGLDCARHGRAGTRNSCYRSLSL